ncbi:pilus assembly protein PilP [Pseudohalocynthiibacter aestuariivivens]|nr:pilus assembly protein PilP [Pseudohalocynthiibacter aestuariivivens]QIE44548.1 pilus assembly protein PilP [Pseudohalocynthiibacter aestuariivivens]
MPLLMLRCGINPPMRYHPPFTCRYLGLDGALNHALKGDNVTDFSDTTTPSQVVKTAATQEVQIPSGTVLIGTVTAKNRAYALVKSSTGKIVQVKPGDQIGKQTVAAIEQGQMILMHNGRTERMLIPGG